MENTTNTPIDYVVWDSTPRGGYASVTQVKHVSRAYELARGVSRAKGFPSDAVFHMNPAHPKDVLLADSVYGMGDGVMLVSAKLRALLEAVNPPDMEYLPVALLNHKGAVASDSYVIANSYHVVEVLDLEAMNAKMNALNPDVIFTCDRLVLQKGKLPELPSIFRPKHLEERILITRKLADQMVKEGMTGVYFWELDEIKA